MSFEAYWWLGEWQRQGWDLDTIIEKTLSWHISSFNGKSMPIPYEWKEKIDGWIRKMGYHFMPTRFSYPETAAPGDTVSLSLTVENCGVAPIYKRLPLYVRLTGKADSVLLQTETDITRWMPGRSAEEIRLAIPEKMKLGTYEIELGIGGGETPSVHFCTDAPMRDHFCCLGTITVQDYT